MKVLYSGISYVIDPSKDEVLQKENFVLHKHEAEEEKLYLAQVENLLGTSLKQNEED